MMWTRGPELVPSTGPVPQWRWRQGRSAWLTASSAALLALGTTGCSLDSLLHSDQVPPDLSDPALLQTPAGAQYAYNGTLAQFRQAFAGGSVRSVAVETGLLTDELISNNNVDPLDQRNMVERSTTAGVEVYTALQKVRGQAGQALGLLAQYLPEQPALRGHLYAIEGYAEVFLAELFCSGIPLSTLDYNGDFSYRPGSSTTEVFTHALALFDTALTLAGDSVRVMRLAQMGRGRALLALEQYANAASAVATVPDDFRYAVHYQHDNFASLGNVDYWLYAVPDREGANGLDWRTSGDPRTTTTQVTNVTRPFYSPAKYGTSGDSAVVLTSGIEARLIEAEAALRANPGDGQWLAKLNALRTVGTQDGDGVYQPGTGGIAGLAPLADPGTAAAQVDLLFRERAFWLFLTGHRQGDLRRLLRQYGQQYGRFEENVYPIGSYPISDGVVFYGSDVTVPIPAAEFVNPRYTGCASRGA